MLFPITLLIITTLTLTQHVLSIPVNDTTTNNDDHEPIIFDKRSGVVPLSPQDVSRLMTLYKFRSAASCTPQVMSTWSCSVCQDAVIQETRSIIPITTTVVAGMQG
ncbi:hypothetical protein HDU76_008586, partial [Blyttiomyces sp. JEL0837]